MLPYTPVHPPTVVRRVTEIKGALTLPFGNAENQTQITAGNYFPIMWNYTGDATQPVDSDSVFPFLPPASSITLNFDSYCEFQGFSPWTDARTPWDDCYEIVVLARKIPTWVNAGALANWTTPEFDYVAAAWHWGSATELDNVYQQHSMQNINIGRGAITITGPTTYWTVAIRPGCQIFDQRSEQRILHIYARAQLGISTYPAASSIRINQPYCVPPFIPYDQVDTDFHNSYIFANAAVNPRPTRQNAAALRHFDARFMRYAIDSGQQARAHIWGGPWKINAVVGTPEEESPATITMSVHDHSHTPDLAVDSAQYVAPVLGLTTASAVRVYDPFIEHPVVVVYNGGQSAVPTALGICVQGGT